MKKFTLYLLVLIGVAFIAKTNAQPVSNIKPAHVIWEADNAKTTIKDGGYGIQQPDSLSLNVFFKEEYIRQLSKHERDFEFKWYFYFSTRKKLIESQIIKFDENNFKEDGSYLITSTVGNVTKGWWEVQVFSRKDNKVLQIGKLTKFQILIK